MGSLIHKKNPQISLRTFFYTNTIYLLTNQLHQILIVNHFSLISH